MGFFDRLFGRKPTSFSLPEPAPEPPPFDGVVKKSALMPESVPTAEIDEKPPMVEVFDSEGNRILIQRQQWLQLVKDNVLAAWNDADALAGIIINGFDDGFFAEMTEAAQHLAEIDSNVERSTSLLSVAYLKTGRKADAIEILESHLSRQGESPIVLTHLAKLCLENGEREKGLIMVSRALQLDPNLEQALSCHLAETRAAYGEIGEVQALEEMASRKGSWRAQLWLARRALERGGIEQAMELYQNSLMQAGEPVPGDLLMQMSGDLGRQAYLVELVELTAPRFQPEVHGIHVGNNLLKAYLDLGQIESARMILDRLYAQKRPDWKAMLRFWEGEIGKSSMQTLAIGPEEELQLTLATFEGPAWLNPHSPAAELFPVREEEGPKVCFFAASVENESENTDAQIQDLTGRLSRALPLYLAEQMHFRTDAKVSTLIPRVVGKQGAFAVMSGAWPDGDAAAFARRGQEPGDYAITAHLISSGKECQLEMRVIRTIDARSVKSLKGSFPIGQPEAALLKLTEELQQVLATEAGAAESRAPATYVPPEGGHLTGYLVSLDQLLGVRCAATAETRTDFLQGERDILENMLRLVRACPHSVSVRVLMIQCFQTMKKVRPDILPEFEDRAKAVQAQSPLPEVSLAVMDRLLRELFV